MEKINGKLDYRMGLRYFSYDISKARYHFERACQDPKFRVSAMAQLMNIDLGEGDCAKVRKQLEEEQKENSILWNQVQGMLEHMEYNYMASKSCYERCLVKPKFQNQSLLALASLHLQLGENKIAREILENLQSRFSFDFPSIIQMIYLEILEQNYEEAYRLLHTIDISCLKEENLTQYTNLKLYLLKLLGRLDKQKLGIIANSYIEKRLVYDDNEQILFKHLMRHMKMENGFSKEIDLKQLLHYAKEKIQQLNPNHFRITDKYRFRLDVPIGNLNQQPTDGLCVVTFLGSKDIITMYPMHLSEKFDQEGFSKVKH